MILEEFKHLKEEKDNKNPFSHFYKYPTGETFYVEPIFYTQMMGFKERHPDKFHLIIGRMEELVKKNKHVVFVGTYDYPQTEVDDSYIYLEITDVTDPLLIFVEDKSRGSDYGD